MAWVKWIDWNAFTEALGHLKLYICRLGGGMIGWWAGERAEGRVDGRAGEGWVSGVGGGRVGGWAGGWMGGWRHLEKCVDINTKCISRALV